METAQDPEAQQQPAAAAATTPQRSNTAKLQQRMQATTPIESIRIKQEVLNERENNSSAAIAIDMVHSEETPPRTSNRDDSSDTVCTEDLYGCGDDKSTGMSVTSVESDTKDEAREEDTQFATVGPRGKVNFQFTLTEKTTDDELSKTKKTHIRNEILRLEQEIGKTWTPDQSILDTIDHAKLIIDYLKKTSINQGTQQNQASEHSNRLIQNPLTAFDALTQQEPGTTVTKEEQHLINQNKLEYSFQLHLKTTGKVSDISLVHTFFEKVITQDRDAQFLAWNAEGVQPQPTVSHKNSIFQVLRGSTKLKQYIGNFNKNRGTLYCRVKINTDLTFSQMKDKIAPWLREKLHWIKEDYIQAKRVSNIGVLLGGTKSVDRDGTRATLERAIKAEIGREVKLDLRLRRITVTNQVGKNITTEIISVSVDSRQVSVAVKGLRAVLNKVVSPPSGRQMFLITQATDEDTKRKTDILLQKHHEAVQQERRSFGQTGIFINQPVHMKREPVTRRTIQQVLCTLRATNGKQLFTGIERMGNSNTTLFTHTQDNTAEARRTIKALPTVLKSLITETDFNTIRDKIRGVTVSELTAVQKVDNSYLDDLLTIHHYTDIDITRKRKKTEDATEVATAVSGLTQVSRTSTTTPLSTTDFTQTQPTAADSYSAKLTQNIPPTTEPPAKPPAMINLLQQRLDQQAQYIEQMKKETKEIKTSMDLIQKNIIADQQKEAVHRAWQTAITDQLTKTSEDTVKRNQDIQQLQHHAIQTAAALKSIMDHLKILPPEITQRQTGINSTQQQQEDSTLLPRYGAEESS